MCEIQLNEIETREILITIELIMFEEIDYTIPLLSYNVVHVHIYTVANVYIMYV